MLTNSEANSIRPPTRGGGDCADSGIDVEPGGEDCDTAFFCPKTERISLRTALNPDGMAPSMMETASTTPTSSSSESDCSFAASSSCVAMLKLTENARSEPSELRAPAALMDGADLISHYATLADVQQFSGAGNSVMHGVDLQPGPTLSVRMLLLNLHAESSSGRGGKCKSTRHNRKDPYVYGGVVFGCTLTNVVHFARTACCIPVSEAVVHLNECLVSPGLNVQSCTGSDVPHMLRGFARCAIMHRQALLFGRSEPKQKIDWKCSKGGTVVGICAAVFFAFSLSLRNQNNAATLSVCIHHFLERCRRILYSWKLSYAAEKHKDALDAERRALDRGAIALRVASQLASKEGMRAYDETQVQLAFLSKGMWPTGKTVDASTHDELCAWIQSADFERKAVPKLQPRPLNICTTWSISLSQLRDSSLPRCTGSSDIASTTETYSSSSFDSSVTSSSGDSKEGSQLNDLVELLAREGVCKKK